MNNRYYVIDYFRVFAIINMILYHLLWDIQYLFNVNLNINLISENIWQNMIGILFIFISGFCYLIGRNRCKRGILILVCGLIITIVTIIFKPDEHIYFGILTFIGSAILITTLLENLLDYINCYIGFVMSLLLFIIFYNINLGTIAFGSIRLSQFLYKGYIMTYLGFLDYNIVMADYYSLLPWIFIFFCGYFAYKIFQKNNWLVFLRGKNIKLITFVSQNSLIIYMLHQIVIYGVLYIIFGGSNV